MTAAVNQRERNTARTRERLLDAAVLLYGRRSIDAVSLREIGAAAGQRNPNALQYHFGDRDGLLQAIVDTHTGRIATLREAWYQRAEADEWPPAEAAARCLVMPIVEYVEDNPAGIDYVRIVSQIRALNPAGPAGDRTLKVKFPRLPRLETIFNRSLAACSPREAQRRVHLVVNTTFHAVSEIYDASERAPAGSPLKSRRAMVEQLVTMVAAFFYAPPV